MSDKRIMIFDDCADFNQPSNSELHKLFKDGHHHTVPTPPPCWPEGLDEWPSHDLEHAEHLLTEAGWKTEKTNSYNSRSVKFSYTMAYYLNLLRTKNIFNPPEINDEDTHFLVGCTFDPDSVEQLDFLNPVLQEELSDQRYYLETDQDAIWPQLIFGLDEDGELTMRIETYEDGDMDVHGEEHVDEATMISRLKEIKKVCDLYGVNGP